MSPLSAVKQTVYSGPLSRSHCAAFSAQVLIWLRANYVPSSSELIDIDSFFQDVGASLNHDGILCQVFSSLTKLELDLDLRARALLNARSLSAPIRRLPVEVLTNIFELYIQEDQPSSILRKHQCNLIVPIESRSTKVSCPTLDLAQTCGFWRGLVQSRPSFWSSLGICADRLNSNPRLLFLCRNYLAHSKDAPLTLCVSSQSPISPGSPAYRLLRELLKHSLRWRHVELSVRQSEQRSWNPHPTSGVRGSFPKLETLYAGDHHEAIPAFAHCPNLRAYTGFWLTEPAFAEYDFSMLQEFTISALFGASVVAFIACMPQLQKFKIDSFISLDDQLISSIPTQISRFNLSTLNTTVQVLQRPEWSTVQLPKLTTLELRGFNTHEDRWLPTYPQVMTNFSTLLLQSDCDVEYLILRDIPPRSAINFLAAHPSVTHFTVSTSALSTELIRAPQDYFLLLMDIIAPNLGCLCVDMDISGSDAPGVVVDVLCKLVEGRASFDAHVCESSGVSTKLQQLIFGQCLSPAFRDLISTRLGGMLQFSLI